MFSLHFNIFIHFLIISQSVTASASTPASNILILIQFYYLYCIHQIICFTNICNATDVYQCIYYCSLNKLYCLMSSMQDIKKSLMLKRFCQTSMPLSITSYIRTVTSIIRWCLKVTTTAMLCFIMWCKGFSFVSFKLTKLLLWNVMKLHLWCVCTSQL